MSKSNEEYKQALYKYFNKRNFYEKNHTCPNCRRVTDLSQNQIFWTKDNHYYAKCGVSVGPCNFKVDIYNGDFISIHTYLTNVTKELDTVKQDIIRLRMKYMFWYGTSIGEATQTQNEEFMKEFKRLMDLFEIVKEEYVQVSREYVEIQFPDSVKQKQIDTLQKEITDNYTSLRESMYDLLLSIQKTGNSEENDGILQSMVQLQIDTNKLKSQKNELQYPIQTVINEAKVVDNKNKLKDGEFVSLAYYFSRLVQYNTPLDNYTINQDPDNKPRVIMFNTTKYVKKTEKKEKETEEEEEE